MILGFPILLFHTAIRYLPFGYLILVMPGIGIILIALANVIATIHFRRVATSVIAIVTRERRYVENYFLSEQTKRSQKQQLPKLPTIEVQFTTQTGEYITLELLAYVISPEIGQPIHILYLPAKPQVASLDPRTEKQAVFGLAIFYCLFGGALIAAGIALFR
jgi:hypothetical protein